MYCCNCGEPDPTPEAVVVPPDWEKHTIGTTFPITVVFTCPACTLDIEVNMPKRYRRASSLRPLYDCIACTYSTHHKREMDTHLTNNHRFEYGVRTDSKRPWYRCQVCGIETGNAHYMRMHLETHELTAVGYTPGTRGTRRKLKQQQFNGWLRQSLIPHYKCQLCGIVLEDTAAMVEHYYDHHPAAITKPPLEIIGKDGNAFAILAQAKAAALDYGLPWAEMKPVLTSGDYNHMLAKLCDYFEVV